MQCRQRGRQRVGWPQAARAKILAPCLAVALLLALAGCSSNEDAPSQTVTFHVSPEGSDEGTGTQSDPWQSLQFAADQLEAGHTLVAHTGTYPAPLVVAVDGAEGAMITIKAADGEAVLIDGSEVEDDAGFMPLVLIEDRSFVRIEGFDIANVVTSNADHNPVGILVTGSGSNIELVGNDVFNIAATSTSGGRDAHGIAIYGTSDTPISDVAIDGNQVHDLTLGTSEAVVLNGNIDGFVVQNNEVYDNDNIGIDVIGFEGVAPTSDVDRARNGVVRNNEVYNIDSLENPVYGERSAAGIYVDGGLDILIENNDVHHNNIGIEIASEHQMGDTSEVSVRDNTIHDNHLTGLAMGGYDEHRGRTTNCQISGNRFEHNDTDDVGWGELLIQFDIRDNTITNNTFVAGPSGRFVTNPWLENVRTVMDDNLFISESAPSWEWRQVSFADFDSYVSATGNDEQSEFRSSE